MTQATTWLWVVTTVDSVGLTWTCRLSRTRHYDTIRRQYARLATIPATHSSPPPRTMALSSSVMAWSTSKSFAFILWDKHTPGLQKNHIKEYDRKCMMTVTIIMKLIFSTPQVFLPFLWNYQYVNFHGTPFMFKKEDEPNTIIMQK